MTRAIRPGVVVAAFDAIGVPCIGAVTTLPGGRARPAPESGTRAARLAQALKGPPVGPAPSVSGTALEGNRWRNAPLHRRMAPRHGAVAFKAVVAICRTTTRSRPGALGSDPDVNPKVGGVPTFPYYRPSSCRDGNAGRKRGLQRSPGHRRFRRTGTHCDSTSGRLGWGS